MHVYLEFVFSGEVIYILKTLCLFISEQLFSSILKVLHTRAYFRKLNTVSCFFLLHLILAQSSHG